MILILGAAAAALVAAAIVGAGIIAGRPDIAAIGMPLLLPAAWAFISRPGAPSQVSVQLAASRSDIGEIAATVEVTPSPGAETALVRVAGTGYQEAVALVDATGPRQLRASVQTMRTGVHEMFRVDALVQAHGAVFAGAPLRAGPVQVAVHPVLRPPRQVPLPWRLTGLTGAHNSRRVGEGFEVHDVHEFSPGDRLKRIDWRVSARRALDVRTGTLGTLFARRTFATADATVMIVIDSRDDVGPDVETWSGGSEARMDEPTSLDRAREAAASLARAYLDNGDRVGLDDLGRRRRPVRPGTGKGQWERISARLVRVAPEGWPEARQRAPQFSSGALVVMCSTFLDNEAGSMVQQWRSQGHRVIAVDTLGPTSLAFLTGEQQVAFRLLMLQRRQRLRAIVRAGVEVVRWDDGAEAQVHALSRSRLRGGVGTGRR